MKHAFILVVETDQTDREAVKDWVEVTIGGTWNLIGAAAHLTVKPEPAAMKEAVAPLIEATKRMKEES